MKKQIIDFVGKNKTVLKRVGLGLGAAAAGAAATLYLTREDDEENEDDLAAEELSAMEFEEIPDEEV